MMVIEPEFCFLEVQIERVFGHSIELHQASFGITPKALNAVDMDRATRKLIVAVIDPQVLVKANINQPIVATPATCVDDACNASLASNNGLQRAFGGIWLDLRVDAVASFKQTENHSFLPAQRPRKPLSRRGPK